MPRQFSRFDFYRRLPADLTEPTTAGGIISIVALSLITLLFLTETWAFFQVEVDSRMIVGQAQEDMIQINMDITFPKLPCMVMSIDIQDAMGRHQVDVEQNIVKKRLSPSGEDLNVIFTHEGDEHDGGHGHHQIPDDEAKVMTSEGCRLIGHVFVNKVPGNLHISVHSQSHLVNMYMGGRVDVSHTINSFWFGSSDLGYSVPGETRPLDNVTKQAKTASSSEGYTIFEYYLHVVPTHYAWIGSSGTDSYQFTSNSMDLGQLRLPGAVYFRYQMSPITVEFSRRAKAWSHFLTYLCAIVGGVFTVAGMVSSVTCKTLSMVHKTNLGKAS